MGDTFVMACDASSALPVEGPTMQMHHRFDVNGVGARAENDGVGVAVEVELAIVGPNDAPAFRFGNDAA